MTALTLDFVMLLAHETILSPLTLCILLLSMAAVGVRWDDTLFQLLLVTFVSGTLVRVCEAADRRLAHGPPRSPVWDEEVVVVTGGSSGLGLLLTEIYAMRSCKLAVIDLDAPRQHLVESLGDRAHFYRCDVQDYTDLKETAQRIQDELGPVSVIINNAAIVRPRMIGDNQTTSSGYRLGEEIRTNLEGPLNVLGLLLPQVLTRGNGGHVVNVCSTLGVFNPVGLSGYAASKAGLLAVHESMRAELRMRGALGQVKGSLVILGQMDTRLFERFNSSRGFAAPVVPARDVAKSIVEQIDGGQGGVIYMPLYARATPLWSILPASFQILLRWWSRIDTDAARSIARRQ